MKQVYFFFTILSFLQFGQVQKSYSQDWQWAISCGKTEGDDYATIAFDRSNNIYLTGMFDGKVGVFGPDSLISLGGGGPYLYTMFCKMNTAGIFQWTKGITSSGYPCANNLSPKVATNKNFNGAWFYGDICGAVGFDSIHFNEMNYQVFIAKYNENGNCLWAKEAGGQGNDYSWEACTDNQGNIYLTGIASDSAQFDSFRIGPGEFIAKYDISGNCVWVNKIADYFFYVRGMAVNENQLILTSESIGLGAMFTISGIPIDGSKSNLIMASYDTDGNVQWAKAEGEGGAFHMSMTGFDSQNDFYFCGSFAKLILGNDTLTPPTIGWPQLFLTKYKSNGDFIWAIKTEGDNSVTPTQICLSQYDDIFLTGMLEREFVINGITSFGGCDASIVPGSMDVDMFVVKYSPDGICLGVQNVQTDTKLENFNLSGGTSVAVDSSGNCIVAGQFINSTVFDPYPLTSEGAKDIYIAKCNAINGISRHDRSSDNRLLIYANPTTGKCNITIPDEFLHEQQLTLQIYDNTGKLIQRVPVTTTEGKISFNIRAEAKGVYNAILSNGKKSFTGKIVFN